MTTSVYELACVAQEYFVRYLVGAYRAHSESARIRFSELAEKQAQKMGSLALLFPTASLGATRASESTLARRALKAARRARKLAGKNRGVKIPPHRFDNWSGILPQWALDQYELDSYWHNRAKSSVHSVLGYKPGWTNRLSDLLQY